MSPPAETQQPNRWAIGRRRSSVSLCIDPHRGLARTASQDGSSSEDSSSSEDGSSAGATALRTRLYGPTLVLLAVTAAFAYEGATVLGRAGQLGRTLSAARVELVGPAVVACVVVAIACERRWGVERRPLLARGHVQDAGYFLVFAAAVVPLVTLLGVASAHLLLQQSAWIQLPSTAHWPQWLLVGVALVAMDGCNWLTHWADHRFAPLWRVHAIHHSQEELSVLTTFRTHPLVHVASFVAASVPVVALMGARPLAPVLVTVYLCLGALPHANVPWTFGPVGRIIVSPAYHRIHHSADGPYDVNLGIVLTIWDQCARRAVFPTAATVACRTGLAGRPLPVEQAAGRLRPLRLLTEQLLEPFTKVRYSPGPADSHHRLAGADVHGLAGDTGRLGRE
jgi:sterol desaturase/sphingolipid hydroxylase (fatty acid hydroxylase superfamily)